MSFYAIRKGHKTGIFTNWDEVQPLVDKYPGASYRKFQSLTEAENFLKSKDTITKNNKNQQIKFTNFVDQKKNHSEIIQNQPLKLSSKNNSIDQYLLMMKAPEKNNQTPKENQSSNQLI